MDEENEILDTELDDELGAEGAEDGVEDINFEDGEDEEDSGDSESASDDFEYDEDGNIIIPDASENEDADDGSEESVEGEPKEQPKTEEAPKEDDTEQKIKALEKQAKATLAKFGIEGDDPMQGLIKLAAEAEGITPEEYAKRAAENTAKENAAREKQAQIERDDLAALKGIYPELKGVQKIQNIPNFLDFGKFRDMGLTVKQAYSAANPDGIREGVAAAVKQQSLSGTKNHIKSNVPVGSKDKSITISKKQMAEYRELFPGMSDKEIVALHKQTMKK